MLYWEWNNLVQPTKELRGIGRAPFCNSLNLASFRVHVSVVPQMRSIRVRLLLRWRGRGFHAGYFQEAA